MQSPESREKLAILTETFCKNGGQHIQYNMVDTDELLDAKAYPEKHRDLVVRVGLAHSVSIGIPAGVKVDIKTPNTRGNDVPAEFSLSGADKRAVGQFAASIRNIRPPEPYLGKGIRYAGEVVKRKVGKAFASGTA